ncbi:hypothetical protein BDZ94DRAFT_1315382 [Collybia nuda]|uniref:Co-chaperone HscB C-terminal oligomerisation domain-containing protein n=1 Tax=Collybia nuda TaxID=64659 RepID=A0A9P5XUZ3_9AGAR|nr:hypothetical protein BDZ94DRAFT_1315382 [Collybia nuda]
MSCGHISTLPSYVKYHDIFALPYAPNPFIIDISTLKQRFREAQAICHPDSWASKGSNQQDVAQALSARINEAYQSLLNPLSRAEYLLRRHHIPVSETDQLEDMELMAEVIEARETIEDAEHSKDIDVLIENNQLLIQNTIDELEVLVGKQQWEKVKAKTIRLRYLENISRAAKTWLDNH